MKAFVDHLLQQLGLYPERVVIQFDALKEALREEHFLLAHHPEESGYFVLNTASVGTLKIHGWISDNKPVIVRWDIVDKDEDVVTFTPTITGLDNECTLKVCTHLSISASQIWPEDIVRILTPTDG